MAMTIGVGDVFKVSSVIPFSQHIPIGSLYIVDTCPPQGYNSPCRLMPVVDPHVLPILTMFEYEIHNFFTFAYSNSGLGWIAYSPTGVYNAPAFTPASIQYDLSAMYFPDKIDSHTPLKIDCDCGAKKTYGENCNEFSHADYCSTMKDKKGVKNG